MPVLSEERLGAKYEIIGLLYDGITSDALFDSIRAHDTEDDWTYWCGDDTLKVLCREFVDTDKRLKAQFKKWNIKTYYIGEERERTFETIGEALPKGC